MAAHLNYLILLSIWILSKTATCHAGSQFLEPDGWFPNHVPNPEDKTAMAAGVHAVQRSASDLGVVLDTDVDRSAVVARDGQPINSNRYIALMSLITLRSAVTMIINLRCPLAACNAMHLAVCNVQLTGYIIAALITCSKAAVGLLLTETKKRMFVAMQAGMFAAGHTISHLQQDHDNLLAMFGYCRSQQSPYIALWGVPPDLSCLNECIHRLC